MKQSKKSVECYKGELKISKASEKTIRKRMDEILASIMNKN